MSYIIGIHAICCCRLDICTVRASTQLRPSLAASEATSKTMTYKTSKKQAGKKGPHLALPPNGWGADKLTASPPKTMAICSVADGILLIK